MAQWSAQRWAQLGISVQFLAMIRTLAEYYRLRHVAGPTLTLAQVEPYLAGALGTAVLAWGAVIAYFLTRYRLAAGLAAATVLALLGYKFLVVR